MGPATTGLVRGYAEQARANTHIRTPTQTWTHAHTHTQAHTHTCTCIRIMRHSHKVLARIHIHSQLTHAYPQINTDTCTHTYIQRQMHATHAHQQVAGGAEERGAMGRVVHVEVPPGLENHLVHTVRRRRLKLRSGTAGVSHTKAAARSRKFQGVAVGQGQEGRLETGWR